MDTSSGKNITDTLIGEKVPDRERLGASPENSGERLVAAAAHLLVAGVPLLMVLLSSLTPYSSERIAIIFWPLLLLFLALLGLSRVSKPRYPMVSYHANQAHWQLLLVGFLLAITAIPVSIIISAAGVAAPGYVLFVPLTAVIVSPAAVAAYRVYSGEGHRYMFIGNNLEASKRWREG